MSKLIRDGALRDRLGVALAELTVEHWPPRKHVRQSAQEKMRPISTDDDSQGKQLNGKNSYAITFAKGQLPPVQGFWSLTLYNAVHFF